VVAVGLGHDHLVDVGRLDTHRAQFADHASGGRARPSVAGGAWRAAGDAGGDTGDDVGGGDFGF
jgi:hypothetical protein